VASIRKYTVLKIHSPLNAAFIEKKDLLLDKHEILLIEDIVQELKPFRSITNKLSSNTSFNLNNFWPMKEYIENMLDMAVDREKNNSSCSNNKI